MPALNLISPASDAAPHSERALPETNNGSDDPQQRFAAVMNRLLGRSPHTAPNTDDARNETRPMQSRPHGHFMQRGPARKADSKDAQETETVSSGESAPAQPALILPAKVNVAIPPTGEPVPLLELSTIPQPALAVAQIAAGVPGRDGQELGQPRSRAGGVGVETGGHGCPRSDSPPVDRQFQSHPIVASPLTPPVSDLANPPVPKSQAGTSQQPAVSPARTPPSRPPLQERSQPAARLQDLQSAPAASIASQISRSAQLSPAPVVTEASAQTTATVIEQRPDARHVRSTQAKPPLQAQDNSEAAPVISNITPPASTGLRFNVSLAMPTDIDPADQRVQQPQALPQTVDQRPAMPIGTSARPDSALQEQAKPAITGGTIVLPETKPALMGANDLPTAPQFVPSASQLPAAPSPATPEKTPTPIEVAPRALPEQPGAPAPSRSLGESAYNALVPEASSASTPAAALENRAPSRTATVAQYAANFRMETDGDALRTGDSAHRPDISESEAQPVESGINSEFFFASRLAQPPQKFAQAANTVPEAGNAKGSTLKAEVEDVHLALSLEPSAIRVAISDSDLQTESPLLNNSNEAEAANAKGSTLKAKVDAAAADPARGTAEIATESSPPAPKSAEAESAEQADGISAAKLNTPMKKVLKSKEFTGQAEQNLPTTTESAAREGLPARAARSLNVAPIQNQPDFTTATFTPTSIRAAATTETQDAAQIFATSLRSVERAHDLVGLYALRLRDSGGDSLQVVIKPGSGLQLSVSLHQTENGIEVRAQLDKGDFAFFKSHWGELQQELEQRGVRVAPLASQSHSGSHGASSSEQSPASRDQQPDDETAPAGASRKSGLVHARMPATARASATVTTARRGWETWA